MIQIEKIETSNLLNAIRGMRNPMNSWDKMDSYQEEGHIFVGENDLSLMKKLCRAGEPHRKFLRQIFICCDITAPIYWWKEFDTYKIGTTTDSCSTMHRLHSREIEESDFSMDHLMPGWKKVITDQIIPALNQAREMYLKTGDKDYWWQMIQLLPSSYNQKRTVTMNYEIIFNIVKYRLGHKLDEWNNFISIMFKQLPILPDLYYATMDEEKDSSMFHYFVEKERNER